MRSISIVFILLLAFPNVHGQHKDHFYAGVKRALDAYDTAWNKKDVAGVSAVLADEYLYFTSTGGTTDRKRTLEFLASPDYKLTFAERSEIVAVNGTDDILLVSSRWKGRGTYGKEVINDDQRCGLVFIRQKGRWKIFSEHCVQIVLK